MFDDARRFRRTEPDFPTTRAAQQRLIAAGRVEGKGPRILFATRATRAPRGPRSGRPIATLNTILALDGRPLPGHAVQAPPRSNPTLRASGDRIAGTTCPLIVAMPNVPPMPTTVLHAMHQAGLLRTAARGPGIILLTTLPPV